MKTSCEIYIDNHLNLLFKISSDNEENVIVFNEVSHYMFQLKYDTDSKLNNLQASL